VQAGLCDIAIGNTYYMAAMLKTPDQKAWADAVRIIFPNAADRGTHVNVSGMALTANPPNKENALRLMEFSGEVVGGRFFEGLDELQFMGAAAAADEASVGTDIAYCLNACDPASLCSLAPLARRLERVRVIHGAWDRTLNHHYGGAETAVFLDPPYRAYEGLYQQGSDRPIADDVAAWAAEHAHLRVAICGHRGDYDLPGWEIVEWSRERNTYGGAGTKDSEAIWFSPACLRPALARQASLFADPEAA